jgi:hypothetical protein
MRKFSECCGAYSEYADEIDICPDCKEHCEFISEDEDDGPEFDSAGYSIADR